MTMSQNENFCKTDILLTLRFLRENSLLTAFKTNMMYLGDVYKRHGVNSFNGFDESGSDMVKYLKTRMDMYSKYPNVTPLSLAFIRSWTREGVEFWIDVEMDCKDYLWEMRRNVRE